MHAHDIKASTLSCHDGRANPSLARTSHYMREPAHLERVETVL